MNYPTPSLFIGGSPFEGAGAPLDVLDPASGKVLARFAGAAEADIEVAIESAVLGLDAWRAQPAVEREAVLRTAASLIRADATCLAALITAENGKPAAEARAEIGATADVLDFYAGEARRVYGRTLPPRLPGTRMMTLREPVGVVAAFTPWNFPAINFIRKVAPALAAGCSVIAKPAEETPATALHLAALLTQAGLPPGALNLLFGVPAEVSSRLIEAPAVRKISFTGSTAVGRTLATQAAAHLKRSTMELGGHAPVVVCADANPEVAADKAAAAKFRNAGQTCNSASRFYVHRSIYERFAERFAANARKVVVGPGHEPGTAMGPLSNARRIPALERLVADATNLGARLLAGGNRMPVAGNFFEPTVLADVPASALILREEPFGPVAPVIPFDTLDEALDLANSTPFGLAAYVFSDHAPSIRRLTQELAAGVIGVNTFVASLPETPFGGVGDSGWGHEGGPEGIEPYLQTRFINEN